jgi:O-antigen/teichoic acid export membrane protein
MGLFFGPVVVGIYRLADRFVDAVLELTLRPIGLVSLPHFSRLQHDRDALRETVSSCIHLVMLTALPALLVLAACSEFVLGIIGPEWVPGADAMMLLCVVGIVKGLVYFTGPLLFAVARPLSRALMLWVIAAINVAAIVAVGAALESASEDEQLLGMSAARALVSVAIVVRLNLVIIRRLAGLHLRTLGPWMVAPLAAGLAAIGLVQAISATGVLDGLPPAIALLVAGGLALGVTGGILFAFEPKIRDEIRGLRGNLRTLRRARPLATGDEAVADVDGVDGTLQDLDRPEPARADR